MTLDVYRGRKTTIQHKASKEQQLHKSVCIFHAHKRFMMNVHAIRIVLSKYDTKIWNRRIFVY